MSLCPLLALSALFLIAFPLNVIAHFSVVVIAHLSAVAFIRCHFSSAHKSLVMAFCVDMSLPIILIV